MTRELTAPKPVLAIEAPKHFGRPVTRSLWDLWKEREAHYLVIAERADNERVYRMARELAVHYWSLTASK